MNCNKSNLIWARNFWYIFYLWAAIPFIPDKISRVVVIKVLVQNLSKIWFFKDPAIMCTAHMPRCKVSDFHLMIANSHDIQGIIPFSVEEFFWWWNSTLNRNQQLIENACSCPIYPIVFSYFKVFLISNKYDTWFRIKCNRI